MKKKFLKLLFTISLVFSFIPISKAGINDCNVKINETSQASPAGFNIKTEVCNGFSRAKAADGSPAFANVYEGPNYDKVAESFSDLLQATNWRPDNKGTYTTYYQRCSSDERKVEAFGLCVVVAKGEMLSSNLTYMRKATENKIWSNCSGLSKSTCNNKSTCTWHDPKSCNYSNITQCTRNGCTWNVGKNGRKGSCTGGYNGYCSGTYHSATNYSCPNGEMLLNTDKCYKCPTGYTYNSSNQRCYKCKNDDYTLHLGSNVLLNNCLKTIDPFEVVIATEGEKTNEDFWGLCESAAAKIEPNAIGFATGNRSIRYRLMCPVYQCNRQLQTFQACTPSFQVGNVPAYCVNPNQGFDLDGGNNYKVDNDFDVTNCQTSYSTVDCGYANIMIEADYHKKKNNTNISDKAIELAMRIWGAHSGQAGFGNDKIGVSRAKWNGSSCADTGFFDSTNVYKNGYNHIFENYLKSLTAKNLPDNYLDVSQNYINDYFSEVTCNYTNMVCGSTTTLRQALALFYNTVLGNRYMQEHLEYLYGNEVNTRPDKVDVETSEEQNDKGEFVKGETNIVLTFDRTVTNTTKTELPLDKRTYQDLTDTQRAYILQYCTVKVDNFCIYNDVTDKCEKIDVNDNDKIYDASKGQIIIDTEYFAVCTSENKNKYKEYQVSVNYKRPTQSTSVKKYVSCSNPTGNQIMFAFTTSENNKVSGEEEKNDSYYYPTEEYSVSLNCTGNCTDYSIKTSAPKCQDNDGGVYTGYVRDPSLKCIVNMYSDTNKSYYDYSEYFKVNTNLCRVYCADEVNYYIADKLTVSSGRSFTYDIKPGGVLENKDNKISSIIEEKRRCVSEIYYNKNFPESIDWKKLYGITDKDLEDAFPSGEKSINNIQDLLTVLFIKSQKENSRDENINQILYDLYNCNLYTEEAVKNTEQEKNGQVVIKENIIRQPQDNKTGNLNKYLKNLYSSENHYGLNNDITNTITYEGGAQYINNKNRFIGTNSDDIKVEKEIRSNLSDISYCSGDNCLEYDVSASQDDNYAYDKFKDESTTATVKNAIEVKKTLTGLTERLNDLYITKIPINDYAMFYTSIQIDFYNDSEFKMEALTGEVKKSTDEGSLDVVALDKYSYPTSKDAYNSGKCKVIDSNVARCDITQTINNMTTYYRRRSLDSFSKYLTSTDFTELTCHIDVTRPSVLPQESQSGNSDSITDPITKYRNVKLSDLFPNGDRINSNWATEYGKIAKNEIEKSSSQINSDLYLEYSFDLTPQSIREIKSYNRKVEGQGGYLNDTKISGTCTQKDNKFFNCKSSFLEEIRGGNSLYVNNNDQKNKFDGISKYTAEKK